MKILHFHSRSVYSRSRLLVDDVVYPRGFELNNSEQQQQRNTLRASANSRKTTTLHAGGGRAGDQSAGAKRKKQGGIYGEATRENTRSGVMT